jgi:cbb3-type cytochrome oxidase maturation protein
MRRLMALLFLLCLISAMPGVAYADHDTLPRTDLNYIGNWIVIAVVAIFEVAVIAAFVWAIRDGQFKNIEGVKYRMLKVDDEDFKGER